MNKCKVCGGDLKTVGAGQYKCIYCGESFTDDDFKPKVQQQAVQKTANEGVDIFENSKNGTVEIVARCQTCGSAGSGLLINTRGEVITNTHVVTHDGIPYNDIVVKIAGENVRANILALGDANGGNGSGVDLALLKLERLPKGAKPLHLEDFNNVRIGEQVYVIGNSLGEGTCMTSGIVSDKSRQVNGHTFLMTDCAINGGNSGGPIFNSKGLVIGVIVASRIHADGSATEGMNYAIPSYIVKEFIGGEHVEVQASGFSAIARREKRKSLAPCPRCGSWNADVENGIFYCYDCEFEG